MIIVRWALAGLVFCAAAQSVLAQYSGAVASGLPGMTGPMAAGARDFQFTQAGPAADLAEEPAGNPGPPLPMGGAGPMDYGPPPVAPNFRSFARNGTFYFRAEALMLRRSNSRPTFDILNVSDGSTFSTGNLAFKNETGQRFHAGYEFNENATLDTSFWEVQSWKPNFNRDTAIVGTTYALPNPTSGPATPLSGTSPAFSAADRFNILERTMIRNAEFNYENATIFDRIALLGGFRYMEVNDLFTYATFSGATRGDYEVTVNNRLLGGQIGTHMFYDLDLWRFEFLGKSGLYDNNSRSMQYVQSLPTPTSSPNIIRDTTTDGYNLAAINEMQLSISRRLTNHIKVRFGYNVMWITNVSLAPDQLNFSASPFTSPVMAGGDMFLYGLNVGVDTVF